MSAHRQEKRRDPRTDDDLPLAGLRLRGDGTPAGQNDGVVEYNSAHIDGVESELVVVRQEQSCQSNPHTIEVRRILLEHLTTP